MPNFSEKIEAEIERCVGTNIAKQAKEGATQIEKLINHIKGCMPEDGIDIVTIQSLLLNFSRLDSNNHLSLNILFLENAGVGEREGRIYSTLVDQRNYGFGHGIGRSGDLIESQPKAAGSSTLYRITNKISLNALKVSGIHGLFGSLIIPMATGMTLALCMRALGKERPAARFIIWPRVDQKSCFKSILCAGAFVLIKGFLPCIIENRLDGEEIVTDIDAVKKAINSLGAESIVCIMTTSSSFAPRAPDELKPDFKNSLISIGRLCRVNDIPHLVNNAYGVQVEKYCNLITETIKKERLDILVQSTDKNFMVPVGGSMVASPSKKYLNLVSSTYAGRASMAPSLDLFITLLEMGAKEYIYLLSRRKRIFEELEEIISNIAIDYDLSALHTPHNNISKALSLDKLKCLDSSEVGRKLFIKSVTGCRVVKITGVSKRIEGYDFKNWGSHIDNYPCDYLTCAASIGTTQTDLYSFNSRLRDLLSEIHNSSK